MPVLEPGVAVVPKAAQALPCVTAGSSGGQSSRGDRGWLGGVWWLCPAVSSPGGHSAVAWGPLPCWHRPRGPGVAGVGERSWGCLLGCCVTPVSHQRHPRAPPGIPAGPWLQAHYNCLGLSLPFPAPLDFSSAGFLLTRSTRGAAAGPGSQSHSRRASLTPQGKAPTFQSCVPGASPCPAPLRGVQGPIVPVTGDLGAWAGTWCR